MLISGGGKELVVFVRSVVVGTFLMEIAVFSFSKSLGEFAFGEGAPYLFVNCDVSLLIAALVPVLDVNVLALSSVFILLY